MSDVAAASARRIPHVAGCVLAALGALMLLAGIGAPALQVSSSPDFGWKQTALVVAGALALAGGLTLQRSWAAGRAHGPVVAVLSGAAGLAFGQITILRPFNSDNLQGLSIATDSPLNLATQPFSNLPVYRPIATLTIWLEHAIVGVNPPSYFLVNLLLWLACAVLVYALMLRLTGMRSVALATALLLLVDRRANSILQVIGDRATTLAIVFGLLAVLIALRASTEPLGRGRLALVFVLLLLASLGKEYGMAFALLILVGAVLARPAGWRALAGVAVGAVALRLGLHVLIAGGATAPYCETLGYFRQLRQACFNDLDPNYQVLLEGAERVRQHLWNIGSTAAGTVFPSMFNPEGAYQWPNVGWTRDSPTGDWLDTYLGFGLLGLALVGLVTAPRRALPFLALLLANAVLSLMLYRIRNELVGAVGLYVLAGLGAATILAWLRPTVAGRWLAPLAVALVAVVAVAQVERRHDELETHITEQSVYPGNLCARVLEIPDATFVELETIRELRHWYDFPDPDCRRGYSGDAQQERLDADGDPVGPG